MKNCYTKDTLQQTIFKHGWTALDIIDAGSSKFKGIQGRFFLLYPFRLNGESAREHQGALILGLCGRGRWEGRGFVSQVAASSPVVSLARDFPNPHLDLGKPVEEAEIKVKNSDKATCFPEIIILKNSVLD